MKKVLGILLKTVVPLALGVYLFWYFFHAMDEETLNKFYHSLSVANYGWILLSLLLSFFSLLSRAYRWRYLLEPLGYQTKFWNRYHALMIGYVMNLTIPRAGEATRSVMLQRSDGVPFANSFGTILAERVFDVIMLLSLALLASVLASDDFWYLKELIQSKFGSNASGSDSFPWFKVVFGGMLVIVIILFWFLRSLRVRLIGFFKKLLDGVLAVFKTRHPMAFIGHTLFIWLMYVTYFGICFLALPETGHIGFTGILLAFIAGSLGISFTNGGIGVFPLVVGSVIAFYLGNLPGSEAQGVGWAVGMLIWSSQTVMMIILGLLSFVLLPKNYTKDGEAVENKR